MQNINFTIAGFGGIAKTHALASFDANLRLNLPFALNLTNVVTTKQKDLKLMNVKNSNNIDEVLVNEDVDFLSICTPNHSHIDYVKKAIQYNKPIYCEKPLSSSIEDAEEMARLVKESNTKNAVALMYRFIPAVRMLKKEIENKRIGEIIDFKICTYHKSYLSEKKSGSWRTLKTSGGGALLDLGVHLVDLVNFALGDIERASAKTKIFFKERNFVDEIAKCEFKLVNGAEGSLEVSRIFAERDCRDFMEVFGTKGSIKVNFKNPHELEIFENENNLTRIIKASSGSEEMKHYPDERSYLGFFQSAHTASLVNFANSVYEGSDVGIAATFEDALKCQRVIDMIYKSLV